MYVIYFFIFIYLFTCELDAPDQSRFYSLFCSFDPIGWLKKEKKYYFLSNKFSWKSNQRAGSE
jgi:hypothetical protein